MICMFTIILGKFKKMRAHAKENVQKKARKTRIFISVDAFVAYYADIC